MLETPRLHLRPMRAGDVDAFLPIFQDAKVMASFGGIRLDRAQMEGWVRRNLEHQAQHGYGLFSVILKANEQLIGDCGLERMELEGVPETELGYDLHSDFWHQGLATEAASAVRDYALTTLALPRLISLIRPGNRASQRVAEKIGMHHEATITRDGQEYGVYALSRTEATRSGPR